MTEGPRSTSCPAPLAPEAAERARAALREVLLAIGEDPDREGLRDTPDRVIRSWLEIYAGYAQDPAAILSTTFEEVNGYDEMIVLRDIPFHSMCEHHMLPFTGRAHVGYLPDQRVVGLSKLARLVDCFGQRLQIQERMTREIAQAIMTHLKPLGCGVILEATHGCMTCRGVKKDGARMLTSTLEGDFKNAATRAEFLTLIRG